MQRTILLFLVFGLGLADAVASEKIRMVSYPSVSPDGKAIAFTWNNDIWLSSAKGGVARQLTQHPALDRNPIFSPDGKWIAFISKRSGTYQVHVMPATGGTPKRISSHSEGYSRLEQWHPDGKSLLTTILRDHYWQRGHRFSFLKLKDREAERTIFDDYGYYGQISPDGKKLLFTREGERPWRKGYHGPRASQIWLYDLKKKNFKKLVAEEEESRWPLWHPDGKSFYYVAERNGVGNLRRREILSGQETKLTQFEDDSVMYPAISKDGTTIVFRRLFDVWTLPTKADSKPAKIEIRKNIDDPTVRLQRSLLKKATEVAFSSDALEVAFIAGGDLWVMDTELRQPVQVTKTSAFERDPLFARDNNSIYFVGEKDGHPDIWRVMRSDTEKPWWQNKKFKFYRLTKDADDEDNLRLTPTGSLLSFTKGRGDFWVMKPDGKEARKVFSSWNAPQYDWSPDGKWLVYSQYDNDFNRDIWIRPLEGDRKPYNLSRHPDNDSNAVWSPDGKKIAFTGRRQATETDIYYVQLRTEDHQADARDSKLKSAVDKIKRARPTHLRGASKSTPTSKATSSKTTSSSLSDDDRKKRLLELLKSRRSGSSTTSSGRPEFKTSPASKTKPDKATSKKAPPVPKTGKPGKPDAPTQKKTDTKPNGGKAAAKATTKKPSATSESTASAVKKNAKPSTAPSKEVKKTTSGAKPTGKRESKPATKPSSSKALTIDFDGLHKRIKRISISNATETGLMWSPDSRKLAFTSTIGGRKGTYTVSVPGSSRPSLLNAKTGTYARWISTRRSTSSRTSSSSSSSILSSLSSRTLPSSFSSYLSSRLSSGSSPSTSSTSSTRLSSSQKIVWLSGGVPGVISGSTALSYSFSARQTVRVNHRFREALNTSWRIMRDNFYDENLGGRDWEAIRKKYVDMAGECPDGATLSRVINLMLGELNGSHLGFTYRGPTFAPTLVENSWSDTTAHLGLRFDLDFIGDGLKVKHVVTNGPADREASKISPGELVMEIDGNKVNSSTYLTRVLTGNPDRVIALKVRTSAAKTAKTREVQIRPTTYSKIRSLLYEEWLTANQKKVAQASDGTFGYVHIAKMNMSSFYRFEEELFSMAAGKKGLIIDVRENGGGSTTDHLLTILTQPRHAITIPRGGGRGYPQDRKIYASWHKPVVVLCNQNSYSNAEIFSHAIRHLKRGKLVGTPTAGGVISTGSSSVMDLGVIRRPFRGWYRMSDGQDMELKPVQPHFVVWPKPGDMPAGIDTQLQKAIKVLRKQVNREAKKPELKLIKASERED